MTKIKDHVAASEAVATDLKRCLEDGMVDEDDRNFVISLLTAHGAYGMSQKQAWWAKRMLDKALGLEEDKPEPETADVGSFAGVIALFEAAAQTIKYPKLELKTADGESFTLSLAGAKAKFPGSVNVTDGGQYPDNTWYGRVHPDGTFEQSRGKDKDLVARIVTKLRALAKDPHGVAYHHGKTYGKCCFCAKTLTHANSLAAGYGPVCASNWGLYEQWKSAAEAA